MEGGSGGGGAGGTKNAQRGGKKKQRPASNALPSPRPAARRPPAR